MNKNKLYVFLLQKYELSEISYKDSFKDSLTQNSSDIQSFLTNEVLNLEKNYEVVFISENETIKKFPFLLDSAATYKLKNAVRMFLQDNQQKGLAQNLFLFKIKNEYKLLDENLNYLEINFNTNKKDYLRRASSKNNIFFQALGKKSRRVLDLTTGLAIDSVFMARNDYQVTALERHPLVFFLLKKAWENCDDAKIKSIEFINMDSEHFIDNYTNKIAGDVAHKIVDDVAYDVSNNAMAFDCFYLDPMYPEKKKNSLSRQEMSLFKNLVGDDSDAEKILLKLVHLKKRVVVKRPLKGKFLVDTLVVRPKQILKGSTTRYDVYY